MATETEVALKINSVGGDPMTRKFSGWVGGIYLDFPLP
jgi:hypothetical protein